MASSYVSELRIVLLGKDSSEISRVGNFILRRKAFDSEAPSSSVKQHNETAGGMVEETYITLINTPHLLDPQLSPEELKQRVRECVHLCSPGPHVFLLVLQSENVTEQDCETIRNALKYFSPFSLEYTIVLITKPKKQRLRYCENNDPEKNKNLQQLISTCRGGAEKIKLDKAQVLQLLKKITKMVEGSRGHLTCQFNEPHTVKCSAASGRGQPQSAEKGKTGGEGVKEKKRGRKKNEGRRRDALRIVLLGKTGAGKSATGNTILDKDAFRDDASVTTECSRETAEVNGRQITVLDTPGLFDTRVGNVEIQKEITKCIFMAAPGPRVFLLILRVGQRFSEEEKGTVEIIQNIFGEESVTYTMLLFTGGDLPKDTIFQYFGDPGSDIRILIEQCGNRFHIFNNKQIRNRMQVAALLEKIDSMLAVNGGSCYTNEMFQQVEKEKQEREKEELRVRYEAEIQNRKNDEKKFAEREKLIFSQLERQRAEFKKQMKEHEELKHLQKELKIQIQEDVKTKEKLVEELERLRKSSEEKCKENELQLMKTMEELERVRKSSEEKSKEKDLQMMKTMEELERMRSAEEKSKENEVQLMKKVEKLERTLSESRAEIKELKAGTSADFAKKVQREETEKKAPEEITDQYEVLLHENFVFSFRNTLEIATYRKLEAEFSKWTWTLRSAMLSIEDKLLNRIANGDLHVGENDLIENMKKTKEEVRKSMMQFFEEDRDKDTLIQWKSRFTSKIGELHDELIRESKTKLIEVIEQKKTKETLEKRKTEYEKKLFNLSKELALRQIKEKADEQTLKTEFDNVWRKWISDLTQDTPKIKDIDFWEDVKRILSEIFEMSLVHDRLSLKAYKNIDINLYNKSEQTQTKRGSTFNTVQFVRNLFLKKKDVAEDQILIRALINDIVEKTSKSAEAIWRAQSGYNSGQVQEIIDLVKNTVKKYQTQIQSFLFSRELTVDLCLYVCDLTEPTFLEYHKQFTKANDPEHYLDSQKEQYYNVYKNFCHGATTTAIFGELLCSKLEPSILEAVYNQTAINVAAEMRASIPALMINRSNLEKHILKTLAEKENFEDYREYIHSPKQYFKRFIVNQADKYLNTEKNKIQTIFRGNLENKNLKINNAVFVATDEVLKKQGNADMWMGCFSKPLKEDLKFTEISNVDFMEITDFDFLCKIVTEGLTKMVKNLHEADIKLKMLQKRSEKILIDHFCQCCWAQCPFCKAICIGTMKDHDGEHSVPFHRANGIIGWHRRGTEDLCSNFCTTVVQTDKKFFLRAESKSVPYKQYRTAGGEYATWNITPDCSELPYWKWFVCRFQKDLENHYGKKFQGSGKIPDEWKKYTKEDALESLDNYI